MTPDFLKQFKIKEIDAKDGSGKKATVWVATEKNGNYQSTALFYDAIMWELERCFKSRELWKERNQ